MLTHGMSNTVENRIYRDAKRRCLNPRGARYKYYGGRGIKFNFASFEDFYKEIGPRPTPKHSLDRINNEGHYEPGNIKWSTRSEQMSNRRSWANSKRWGKGYYNVGDGSWQVSFSFQGKRQYGGQFTEEILAKQAYDSKLKELQQNLLDIASKT